MVGLKCNIDADMVAYEVAIQGQHVDENSGEDIIHHFSYMDEYILQRVEEIMDAVGSKEAPALFLTGDNNFRFDVAKRRPYKSNRKPKPYHLANVRVVMANMYHTLISPDDEADDELAMAQTEKTVCCSRDKDLKQIPGWHYGWESGLQPEQPLHYVEGMGFIEGSYIHGVSLKTGKPTKRFRRLDGEGYLFFLAQMLMGDPVDTIPGCKGIGGGKADDALRKITDKATALKVVEDIYKEVYGEETFLQELEEQANLVWMVRSRDAEGKLQHWSLADAKACTTYEM